LGGPTKYQLIVNLKTAKALDPPRRNICGSTGGSQPNPYRHDLENLRQHVRECLRRAEESAERAKRAPNPDIRRDFLEIEGRWLKLARSYQFLEQLWIVYDLQQ
jgi:hypothetical protein